MKSIDNLAPSNKACPETEKYDASCITVLSGLEAVRKNPSMYIGSTDADGLHHMVFEAVDNAIDEALAGYCTLIEITLHRDGSCSVFDNGRGIPTENHPTENCPACEVVFTRLYSGGKFHRGSYHRSSGLHGVGISCVNALSAWLDLEIWRDGHHYRERFARGSVVSNLEDLGPASSTGTKISFLPDPRIFPDDQRFGFEFLAQRLEELAFLHQGISIRITDEALGETRHYQYDTGITGFIKRLTESTTALHPEPVMIEFRSEDVEFELAMQWTSGYGENIHSYVNSVNTIYGGSHVSGLKTGLTRSINAYAAEAGLLNPANGERITTFDILEGLTCVLAVRMNCPQYESQTKTSLSNHFMLDLVDRAVYDRFLAILRDQSSLALKVVNRALDATRARVAARLAGDRARFQVSDFRVSEEVYKKQFGIRSKNWHQSAVWIANEELLHKHVEHLKFSDDARLLDVCCGSGVVGGSFRGKVKTMIGLDLTPEMVKLARERLDEVHQGTVYDIPFPAASFEVVVTREVLHLLPNPQIPVAEIYRVLKPGGQFIVGQILPFGHEDGPWMYRVFKKKQPLIFNMFQEDDFRALLLGAGFNTLEMTEYNLWESIDVWINTHETTNLHRHEIRDLFYNAPPEVKAIHPFEILPSGEIRDLWRWCIFSCRKPT